LQRDERIVQVREVLAGIGAGEIRELKVFNKIDLMGAESPRIVLGSDGVPAQAWVSAHSGAGLGELREAIAQAVRPNQVRQTLHLDMLAAALRSDLYRREAVRAERQCDDGSWELDVELDPAEMAKILGSRGVMPVAPPEKAREVA
jgi:GTP-binding protein HflX